MRTYLADIETNGLNPDTIHCIVIKDYNTKERWVFSDMGEFEDWWAPQDHTKLLWVFHNGLGFDVPVINKLTKVTIPEHLVIDTMVVSKLKNYKKHSTHSLKELGEKLGVHKGDYEGSWDKLTPDMLDYCIQDVEVLEAIFEDQHSFIYDKMNRPALRLEHDTAAACAKMSHTGFPFNEEEASSLLSSIKEEMKDLEDSFKSVLGKRLIEDRRLKLRYNKDGTMNKKCLSVIEDHPFPYSRIDDDTEEIVVMKDWDFNPGSHKQCIDVLWEYGWNPTDKTKGHINAERK